MRHFGARMLSALMTILIVTSACLYAAQAETAAPTVVENETDGYWLYQSDTLRVEINRREDAKTPLVWYEADLQCSADAPLACVLCSQVRPSKHLKKPDTIAVENGLIYAQTDDFFGDRVGSRKRKTGVIIRGGKILYDSVYHGGGNPFPTLDALAIFPDGSLETFSSREYTGEQFLQMGVLDVVSFGPILIRDGVMDSRLVKGYADHEPRCAIGMITPYHYFGIVVEGRSDESEGCGLKRIAQRMLEVGVTEALNLDGGQTAAMLFMGKQLNRTGKFGSKSSPRSVSGVLGIKESAALDKR
jgi:hypothetical protein